MIERLIFLAAFVGAESSGNSIGTFLENAGFYSYILPFLLLFALIFGVLSKLELFKDNKGVIVLIAMSVSLMALQVPLVPKFFAELFPKVGVGLSIILGVLILFGMFIDKNKQWILYILLAIGAIITAVVVYPSFSDVFGIKSSASSYDIGVILGWVLVGIVVLIAIAAIVGWKLPVPKSSEKSSSQQPYHPYLFYPPAQSS